MQLHSNAKHVNFPINLQWQDGWLRLLYLYATFLGEGTNIYSFYTN